MPRLAYGRKLIDIYSTITKIAIDRWIKIYKNLKASFARLGEARPST